MRTQFFSVAVILLLCLSASYASPLKKATISKLSGGPRSPSIDLCPTCVALFDNAINDILNVILNGGVIGSCGALCQQLDNQIVSVACDLICDYVGITEFINLVEEEDPDPIFLCQEVDLCPIVEGGQVNITSATVSPKQGPQGTTFTITMVYNVVSATGPGLVVVNIVPPADMPFGDEEFEEGQSKGAYKTQWQLQANPSEGESFSPGVYQVQVAVCAGDCTTAHAYGGVYAQANLSFRITG